MQLLKKIPVSWIKTCLDKYAASVALWIDLILVTVLYAQMAAHVPTQNGDNIEHIHSSFLIARGYVPYLDFFQHHNPLLWYLFAPLVGLLAYNATITEIVCIISLLLFLKSLVFVYRISAEFLSDKLWGLVAAAAVAIPGRKLYAVDFRPDNYMIFCLTAGLYYYFSYLKGQKPQSLAVAFFWFFISFLFAQKALFPLAVLGGTGIYFWYRGAIKSTDMGRALLFPAAGVLFSIWFLCHYDMLMLYYQSNYTFNLNLAAGFDAGRIVEMPPFMVVLTCVALIGTGMAVFSKNRYWKIIALLFLTEFVQRKFYFSPYAYYFWLMVYLAALCGVPAVRLVYLRFKPVIWLVIAGLYWTLYQSAFFQYNMAKVQSERKYLPDYIARNISPCDYVFNGDGMMYNLFGKDPAYYWQLIGQLDVIGEQTGIRAKPDINALIMKLKPKFVYGRSYFNKFSDENRRPEIVHYVDRNLLETFYFPTSFGVVYQLKPEYDKRKCIIDAVTGKYRFADE